MSFAALALPTILLAAMHLMPVVGVNQRIVCFDTNDLFGGYHGDGYLHAFAGISQRGDVFDFWLHPTGDFVWTVTPVGAAVSCPIAGGVRQ